MHQWAFLGFTLHFIYYPSIFRAICMQVTAILHRCSAAGKNRREGKRKKKEGGKRNLPYR